MKLLRTTCLCAFIFLGTLKLFKVQCQYSKQDSIELFKLLERADELDFEGKLNESLKIVDRVIIKSQLLSMRRSLGFAYLKKADLLLKKTDYKDLLEYYHLGLELGLTLKDSLIMGLAHHQTSQYYRDINNYTKALEFLDLASQNYSQQKDLLYLGMVQNDIAYIHSGLGDYQRSVEHYLNAVRIFDILEEEKEKSNSLSNLGTTFYRLNDKKQSIRYFLEALSIQEKLGDTKRIAATAGNLATLYTSINLDSALHYQIIQVEAARQSGIKSAQAFALSNLANLQFKKMNFSSSLENYLKANLIYKESSDANKIVQNLLRIAQVFDHMDDSIQAENYFDKAYQISSDKNLIPLLQSFYEAKSNFYKRRQNYSGAFLLYEKSIELRDSLLNEKSKAHIAELNLKYDTEKKESKLAKLDAQRIKNELELEKQLNIIRLNEFKTIKRQKEIELLKKEKELNNSRLREVSIENEKQSLLNQNQLKNIEWLETSNLLNKKVIKEKETNFKILFLLSSVSILLFFLAFNRYKLKKQLAEQKNLMDIRNKIAIDLHDDIGSTLTSISILSQISANQMEQQPSKAIEMMQSVADQSKKIQHNMSDIVWAFRSDNEKMEAMTQRIREYCSKTLEPLNISFELEVKEDLLQQAIPIQSRKELILMAKELINNVVKHSQASTVQISFTQQDQFVVFSIQDNGKWKGTEKNSGTGLKSMRERAQKIGGRFELHHMSTGTRAIIKIPN